MLTIAEPAVAAPAASEAISVCIVSHNAYATFTRRKGGFVGGVEWQTSLLARWLARRGHRVSLVTWDEGGPPDEMVDGVRLIRLCRSNAGLPGLRFLHPKWTSLAAALRAADAQVYYHNCGEGYTGQIALWCRSHGRRFVFSAASEMDCTPDLPELHAWKDRALYRYGLRTADLVLAQTQNQQRLLHASFGVSATVMPMPCEEPVPALARPRPAAPAPRVLWVGRVCPVKRPDRLVEVAAALLHVRFDIVGPHYADELSQRAMARAATLPNITVHGALPRGEVADHYAQTALLLCTSDREGFPNTFLEAWSQGVPVVSTFDPDGVIQANDLGYIGQSAGDLAGGIETLLTQPGDYAAASRHALEYFGRRHAAGSVLPRLEALFTALAARAPRA